MTRNRFTARLPSVCSRPHRAALAVLIGLLCLVSRGATSQPQTTDDTGPAPPQAPPVAQRNLLGLAPDDCQLLLLVDLGRLLSPERSQALVAATVELVETVHGPQPMLRAHLEQLYQATLGTAAAHIRRCLVFSERLWPNPDVSVVCDGDFETIDWLPDSLAARVERVDPHYLVAGPSAVADVADRLEQGLHQDLAITRSVSGITIDRTALLHGALQVPADFIADTGAELLLSGVSVLEVRATERDLIPAFMELELAVEFDSPATAEESAGLFELLLASWAAELPAGERAGFGWTRQRLQSWLAQEDSRVRLRPDATAIPAAAATVVRDLVAQLRTRRAQTAETTLDQLVVAAQAEYGERQQFPAPTPLIPEVVPCGGATPPEPTDWEQEGWQTLGFSPTEPLYYSYQLLVSGTAGAETLTLRAHGDLDCDGVLSRYQRVLRQVPDGLVVGELEVEQPLE